MASQNIYRKYTLLLLISALLITMQGIAQSGSRTISGTITTEGIPLEGVLVLIKGSDYFSGTQPDGVFYIPVSLADSVLVLSLEGYQSKELKLSDKNEYKIELKKKSGPLLTAHCIHDTTDWRYALGVTPYTCLKEWAKLE